MAQYEWSEVFMSIEGEGPYAGHPTVYIRFARCNFKCRGFNNPENLFENDGYATLGFDPKDFKTLESIPLLTRGCDSQYSINPKFSHMWHKGDEKELAAEVLKVLPYNTFKNPVSGQRVILSLTGGEPTIRLKFWVPILEELYAHGMRSILVETNCAAPLRDKDVQSLYDWINEKNRNKKPFDQNVHIIWSNSPKLTSSGETWDDAIRPEIAFKQMYYNNGCVTDWRRDHAEQYFKFVCGPNEEDFNEVKEAMHEYNIGGVYGNIYVMPVACTEEQQQAVAAKVAKMCIDHGYIYCHRIQNSVFGNGVGT